MQTITVKNRRDDTSKTHDRECRISLPAPPLGITFDGDRCETSPDLPTIRYSAKPPHIHGCAKAAMADRKINDIAAAIMAARSALLPAVTVAIEAQG